MGLFQGLRDDESKAATSDAGRGCTDGRFLEAAHTGCLCAFLCVCFTTKTSPNKPRKAGAVLVTNAPVCSSRSSLHHLSLCRGGLMTGVQASGLLAFYLINPAMCQLSLGSLTSPPCFRPHSRASTTGSLTRSDSPVRLKLSSPLSACRGTFCPHPTPGNCCFLWLK